MITAARARELLIYHSFRGVFTRRCKRGRYQAGSIVKGGINTGGYPQIYIEGQHYCAHKLAWLWVYGYYPKQLDHKNTRRADYRLSNLREATKSEDSFNRRIRINNKAGYKGVSKIASGRYRANICVLGKCMHLGVFDSPQRAHRAYMRAAKKFAGQFARSA